MNWSYKLYKITEIKKDQIPSYHIDNLPERYNEALLKKRNVTMKEKKPVFKAINVNQIKMPLPITTCDNRFIC